MNNYFKKAFLYVLGLILVAFGIALHQKHFLGNGPFTQFNVVLGEIFSLSIGTMMIIIGFTIIILYFLKKRNKDIYLSILAALLLGIVVDFFNDVVLSGMIISENDMFLRLLVLLLATNIVVIGVVLMLKTKLSMLDMEMLTILVNETKPCRNMNFGQVRMILDGVLVGTSILLSVIIIGEFVITEYIVAIAIVVINGPLVNIYSKIFDKLFLNKNISDDVN